MNLTIDAGGKRTRVQAREGATVLDVLQEAHVHVQATCGGVGKCRRCQVLVRDETGLSYRLACTTPAAEGMEVVVEEQRAMEVLEGGDALRFAVDEGQRGFGLSVDIGTTTVVANLHDLSTGARLATTGRANPQIAFGSDVISRISASVDGKLDMMRDIIQDALRDMKARLCEAAGVDPDAVGRAAIAGNTVMEHIAAGLPPDSIGVNPFTPVTLFGDTHRIEGLGECYFAYCIAGYVGGDITAGMLARGLDEGGTRLFLDLGTNGEMALAHDGRITCCATAAGPVFEGANIHFGMPAAPGAISQVRAEGGGLAVKVIGDAAPVGICGTGIIDAVARAVELGIVDETGYLQGADELPSHLAPLVGKEDGGNVLYLVPDRSVYLTQGDVRSVQLAKAAVCGGVRTMLDFAHVEAAQVERLEIAGGFGRFLDLASAARVGLFPAELLDRAASVGNTSAEGAAALLVSGEARRRERAVAERCDYLELSTSAAFNRFYVEEMDFE